MKLIPASFRKRLVASFSVLIMLFMAIIIGLDTWGIPGTDNYGKFGRYRVKAFDEMSVVSGLLAERVHAWFLDSRSDIEGLARSLPFMKPITGKEDLTGDVQGRLESFKRSSSSLDSISLEFPESPGSRTAFADRNPGYEEIITIDRGTGGRPCLRISRLVFATRKRERVSANLIADYDIEGALTSLLWSSSDFFPRNLTSSVAMQKDSRIIQYGGDSSGDVARTEYDADAISFPPFSLALSGIDGPYEGVDENGAMVLAYHRHVRLDSGLAFALVLRMDRARVLEPAWADLARQCAIWLFMLVLGILVSVLLASLISRPVKNLIAVAKRIEAGDLSARAAGSGESEIGKFVSVFNDMVGRLQSWNQELEGRVYGGTAALRQNEEQRQTILQAAMDGFWMLDAQGRIMEVNAAYCSMSGYTQQELTSMTISDIEAEETSAETSAHMAQIQKEGTGRFETRHRRKDGTSFDVEVSVQYHDINGGRLVSFLRDITERKSAEAKLRRSLREKEILLREIHHRVKNNLNVISSLLSLQSSYIKTPQEAIKAFQNSRDRIMAMSLVHKVLYESGDFGHIDMSPYMQRLTQVILDIYDSGGRVGIRIDAAGVLLPIDQAIPCGLILNELMTNAFKYAFPEERRGEISIVLKPRADGYFELQVIDDGIGLPSVHREGATLGFILVRSLAEQLGGTLVLANDVGTHCSIRFPRAMEK